MCYRLVFIWYYFFKWFWSFSGTFVFTNHNLFDTLCTCVSTAITFVQNNTWETTFAVLIPTQGRVVKDFKSEDNISGFFLKSHK